MERFDMKISKKIITLIICIFAFGIFSTLAIEIGNDEIFTEPGLENFTKQNTYTVGLFTDVAPSAWYAENVATAYELGLVKGTSATTFGVSGNITIAETIALAARIDSIFYTGQADFVQGTPWYQCYVDYAVEVGIITSSEYSQYNATATRAQFATILSRALPSYVLDEINWIDDGAIPDVKSSDSYGEAVYMLYRAGILTGSDSEGTFKPQNTISRPEVAAIVTRMADKSLRKSIMLVGEY